jgi:GNAT superfamily N-acetyltransferase
MIEIIAYNDSLHEDFRQLNLEWLDHYQLREDADMLVLNDPNGTILNNGGFIYLAKAGDEIVGTAALIQEANQVYELAKMSVTEKWRGKGISKLLLEACLRKAAEIEAVKIELFSNHQLIHALKLYEQYGFVYVDVKDSPFETADIKMELRLKNSK